MAKKAAGRRATKRAQRVRTVAPIQWTGSNLGAVKRLHRTARTFPNSPHPHEQSVLHVDDAEGNTIVVQKGQHIRQFKSTFYAADGEG